jgi:hypothetical protein
MITEIGIVSGEILELLEGEFRPWSIREIQEHLDEPLDVVMMSVGWLLREKYLVENKGRELYVTLASDHAEITVSHR